MQLDSVILLEPIAPDAFDRHSLETVTCDHFTCAAGDIYHDGAMHLVTGSFSFTEGQKMNPAVTVWENRGPRRRPTAR